MILEVVQSKWSLTWYDPLGPTRVWKGISTSFLFISLSRIPCPFFGKSRHPGAVKSQIPHHCLVKSQILRILKIPVPVPGPDPRGPNQTGQHVNKLTNDGDITLYWLLDCYFSFITCSIERYAQSLPLYPPVIFLPTESLKKQELRDFRFQQLRYPHPSKHSSPTVFVPHLSPVDQPWMLDIYQE